MKWLVIGVLLCLAKFGAGGALLSRVSGVKEVHLDKKENEKTNQPVPETPSENEPVTFEPECDAGSEWESNCHSCKCSDDGVALCTRQEFCDQPLADPIRCKPNTVIQRDCNTCVCLENGLGLCTMKECGKSSVSQKPTPVAAGRECAPGTTWVSRCNRCFCSAEGLAVCNYDEGCPGMESLPNMRCAAGTHWRNDCNMCWCADGVPLCTRKGCLTDKLEIRKVNETLEEFLVPEELENNLTAKESSSLVNNDLLKIQEDLKQLYVTILELRDKAHEKSYNLNIENVKDLKGNDVESDKVLEQENEIEKAINGSNHHVVLKRSVCKPNQAFQTDCNVCKCAADGQSYTCTHNECMEGETNKEVEVFMESEGTDHIEKHSVCKPAGTFYIGCNTCHCNFFGTDYSCTNKPCPLPEDVELFHELKITKSSSSTKNKTQKIVCVANRMFIKDCNTCWCNDDGTGFFCTRKVCVPEIPDDAGGLEDKKETLRVIKKECRPDEVFELDCNMCRCNPDGKSFSCTRRACVESVDEENKNMTTQRKKRDTKEPPKTCQPGQEFRMDCNKCLCDNNGQEFSCTRNDCNAVNNHFSSASAGARAKREISETENITMECAAGSVFDKDCNVCRCSENGHHAICTIKRCPVASKDDRDSDKSESADADPESDPNFRCNPGEQFKRGCNDCSCSADGKSVFCTVMFCDQDVSETTI